jgi:hypothetical protein
MEWIEVVLDLMITLLALLRVPGVGASSSRQTAIGIIMVLLLLGGVFVLPQYSERVPGGTCLSPESAFHVMII